MEPGCSSLQPSNIDVLSDDEAEGNNHHLSYVRKKGPVKKRKVESALEEQVGNGLSQKSRGGGKQVEFKTYEATRRHVVRVLTGACPCAKSKRPSENCFRAFAVDELRKSELIRTRYKLSSLHKHDADEKALRHTV